MTRTMFLAALALSSCSAAPAFAQTISGCGTTAIAKADQSSATKLKAGAECFAKAKVVAATAEVARRTRLAAITPAPAPVQAPVPPPTPAPAPAPAVVPVAGVPAMQIGINVSTSVYYNTERIFANLAYAASPWRDPTAGWGDMAASKLNAAGLPRVDGVLPINVPQSVWSGKDTPITCTWKGKANVRFDGDGGGGGSNGSASFIWKGFDIKTLGAARPSLLVYVTGATDADPLTEIDCRETGGIETVGVFDKRYVDDMRPFKVLRFLDWSSANGNPAAVTWATRGTPLKGGTDGTALEHMIDLANATGADPWFTVPWNADDDYIRRAGTLVRDRLGKGQRAYFELSNEVWNFQFGQTGQALQEGLDRKLAADKYTNHLYRLGQKSTAMMKVLTDVYAAEPGRLVRVISAQNDNPWAGERVLEFQDTAKWHDAFATAPYFGHSFFDGAAAALTTADAATLDASFVRLEAQRVDTLAKARANRALATKYGVRYIAYEAGQHIIATDAKNAPVAQAMQRDPRMGELYRSFLADWKAGVGDQLTLYSATGTISQYGAWGVREYAGQPIDETPKRRAVLDAIGTP